MTTWKPRSTAAPIKKNTDPLRRYNTPEVATLVLLDRVRIDGLLVEPCVGEGAISRPLTTHLQKQIAEGDRAVSRGIVTGDIDPNVGADRVLDATQERTWLQQYWPYDWAITNPEFSIAHEIIPHALKHSRVGIAMLLRITWIEPTESQQPRGEWLSKNPPSRLIVLPRLSFKTVVRIDPVTKERKVSTTDSATCAWYIWYKFKAPQKIEVVTKSEMRRLMLT